MNWEDWFDSFCRDSSSFLRCCCWPTVFVFLIIIRLQVSTSLGRTWHWLTDSPSLYLGRVRQLFTSLCSTKWWWSFCFFFVYKTKPNPFQHDTMKLRLSLICWMQLILTLNSFSSCVIITVTGMNLKSPTTNTHKHSGGVRSLRRNNTHAHNLCRRLHDPECLQQWLENSSAWSLHI